MAASSATSSPGLGLCSSELIVKVGMVQLLGMGESFYIDKAPKLEEEAKAPKPLIGVWWKYGLALSITQLILWAILGYKLDPEISILFVLKTGALVYGMFIFMSFLPFVLGRLGLKRLMWFGLAGVLMGMGSYYLLALFEPTRRFNLLPFVSYLQLSFAGFTIGLVWELGRYVYKKLKE